MSEKPDMQVEEGKAAYSTALPEQKAFFKIPARFGHVPVAEEPLGYDHERRFPGRCPKCHAPFQATQLLYPVKQKNYPKRPFIWDEWQDLRDAIKQACILTIFGFGAPGTDVEAVELIRTAWPAPQKQMAQWVELINKTPKDELLKQWDLFILSHHADTTTDFYESRIACHPRRTGEAWAATHLFAMWEDGHPLPKDAGFPELWAWFDERRKHEDGTNE